MASAWCLTQTRLHPGQTAGRGSCRKQTQWVGGSTGHNTGSVVVPESHSLSYCLHTSWWLACIQQPAGKVWPCTTCMLLHEPLRDPDDVPRWNVFSHHSLETHPPCAGLLHAGAVDCVALLLYRHQALWYAAVRPSALRAGMGVGIDMEVPTEQLVGAKDGWVLNV